MATPSSAELAQQLSRVKRNGWLPFFSTGEYDIDAPTLLAVSSRETNIRNILGDYDPITGRYHGHGLCQIDDRYYPEWCASGKWQDPREAVRMGACVLRSKINGVSADKRVMPTDALRVGIAAYNGSHAIEDYLIRSDPDFRTTGHDYSRDVLARAAIFKRLLG